MSKQTKISSLFALGKRQRETPISPKKRSKKKQKKYIDEDDDFEFVEPDCGDDHLLDMDDLEPESMLDSDCSPERNLSPPPVATIPKPRKISVPKKKQSSVSTIKSPRKTTPKKKPKVEKRYDWLTKIRDVNKNLPSDPEYDPRTLYIPESAFTSLSPFEAQFWRVKQQYFDTIVFFKKGKFYELYEMDADVGKKEFDLKMTDRVNMRMVGVPESSIHQWAAKFLARGYKITQVDQVESSIAMNRRVKSSNSKKKTDKVIKREVTRILTQGTLLDEGFIADFKSHFLMSIKESVAHSDTAPYFVKYGICILDCSVGKISFCTLEDDAKRTELQTILVQTNPKEFILEKGQVSEKTQSIITAKLNNPNCNFLPSGTEFLSRDEAIAKLKCINNSEEIPMIVARQDDLCLSAFGACLSYLSLLKISDALIPNCTYHEYSSAGSHGALALDSQALINLEILENNVDHSAIGSLFNHLDHCSTKCGQRLLRSWVCSPLQDIDQIEQRLDSIDWFSSHPEFLGNVTKTLFAAQTNPQAEKVKSTFSKLPDLERAVSRLKSGRNLKVSHLVEVIESLHLILRFISSQKLSEETTKGNLLDSVSSLLNQTSTLFTSFKSTITDLYESFDQTKAKKENFIEPKPGKAADYDSAGEKVQKIRDALEKHLVQQRKRLGVPIKFTHMQKEKYQLEISCVELSAIKLPGDYQVVSNTKQVKRFYDAFIQNTLKELADAEEDFNVAKEFVFQHFLDRFNASSDLWMSVVRCVAEIDVLCSLTTASTKSGVEMCRPQFVRDCEGSFFDVRDMKHPMLCAKDPDRFISNSVALGTPEHLARVILLTGPNMGGKSTLLRQLCLLVVMAQVGCYVPASYCKLSAVDRIFTRLGASDDIIMGQSTFMVELQETATILKHVTDKSLVILDELGRGTSTFDGYSIAYATLSYLSMNTKASILFSTHYHALTKEFDDNQNIELSHMACHVDEDLRDVVFLYQLQKGVCPSSYGMNVALAAGLSPQIVDRAIQVSKEFRTEIV